MKRIARTNQRHPRWSFGCAHLELAGAQLDMPGVGRDDSPVVLPAHPRNRYAPRGSAAV